MRFLDAGRARTLAEARATITGASPSPPGLRAPAAAPALAAGLAGEGARELLRHGFTDLGLDAVVAETMAVNEASRATMRSIGLRHVRTFHVDWAEPIPGSEHGEVEYAVTREQRFARGR